MRLPLSMSAPTHTSNVGVKEFKGVEDCLVGRGAFGPGLEENYVFTNRLYL